MEGIGTQDNKGLDLAHMLLFFWRHKWVLGITTLLAAILSYFIVKLIPPTYESYAILFPSATFSRDKQIEEFQYGMDVHAERLVQLLDSDMLRDSLFARFDLMKHLGIDPNRIDAQDELVVRYYRMVHIEKTRYKSVAVVVQDTDPKMAADIANEISRLANVVNANIMKESAERSVALLEEEYKTLQQGIFGLNDSISLLLGAEQTQNIAEVTEMIGQKERNLAILHDSLRRMESRLSVRDPDHQVSILNTQLAGALADMEEYQGQLDVLQQSVSAQESTIMAAKAHFEGARRRAEMFRSRISAMGADGSKLSDLQEAISRETNQLNLLLGERTRLTLANLDQSSSQRATVFNSILAERLLNLQEVERKLKTARLNFEYPLPVAFTISQARPSLRKVSPITSVYVLSVAIFVFLFTSVFLALRSRLRELLKEEAEKQQAA